MMKTKLIYAAFLAAAMLHAEDASLIFRVNFDGENINPVGNSHFPQSFRILRR